MWKSPLQIKKILHYRENTYETLVSDAADVDFANFEIIVGGSNWIVTSSSFAFLFGELKSLAGKTRAFGLLFVSREPC